MSNSAEGPGLNRVARLMAGEAPKRDLRFECPECKSKGFMPSLAGVGKGCEFCDGTVNGEGPRTSQRYRHKKTGVAYTLIGVGLQEATGEALAIYATDPDDLGCAVIWVRPYVEFFDGRFETIEDGEV